MRAIDQPYFSGVCDDYSNYRWFKGEATNPYKDNSNLTMAASLWEYEKAFHSDYLNSKTDQSLKEAYQEWKESFIKDYLPGKSSNPYGDLTDWENVFNTGVR